MITNEFSDSLELLINDHPGVLAYFYNDDCLPCLSLRPKIAELISKEFPEIRLVFINIRQHGHYAQEFGIYSSPVIISFFKGKEYYRWSKYTGTDQIRESLQRPYDMLFS